MGFGSNKKSSEAPSYPMLTIANTGLFGKSTTTPFGTTFKPTDYQKKMVGVTEKNALPALESYLHPDYESKEYKQGEDYFRGKMQNMLENDYLNPALQRNLLRGSTAADVYRGFANDLSANEYERQQDYRNQQYQNYMAAMQPYSNVYDMSMGVSGLSQALANSIANYNADVYRSQNSGKSSGGSSLGALLGQAGPIAQAGASAYGTWSKNHPTNTTTTS